jgi:hypothetical protein
MIEKKYFVLHLLPMRPDFAQTKPEDERSIMEKHVAYRTEIMIQGKVLAFGPVPDPKSVYGLGVYNFPTSIDLGIESVSENNDVIIYYIDKLNYVHP